MGEFKPAAAFSMTNWRLLSVFNAVTVTQAKLIAPAPPASPTNFRKAFHVSVTGPERLESSVGSVLRRSQS